MCKVVILKKIFSLRFFVKSKTKSKKSKKILPKIAFFKEKITIFVIWKGLN